MKYDGTLLEKLDYNQVKHFDISGKEKEEDIHENGVALLLSKDTFKSHLEWEPISESIIRAKFLSKFKNVHIIMCYAPTNLATEEDKTLSMDNSKV